MLSGCIIDVSGGKWPEGWTDTGSAHDPEETAEDATYSVVPDLVQPGMTEVLTVMSEDETDWPAVVGVTAIGDLEVLDFKRNEDALYAIVEVPDSALDGPVHLVIEFENGDVHIAREAVFIEAIEEGDPGDTGLVEDEPNND
jgi:hypothetical protein